MSLRDSYTYEEPDDRPDSVTLPKGEYPFEVVQVFSWEETKAGNDMLPLMLRIDGGDHGEGIAYENLVFTDSAKWKIDQFLKSIFGGALKPGKKVDFRDCSWMKGRTGMLRCEPKPVPGKDYQRNEVKAFTYPETKLDKKERTITAPPEPDPEEEDDDDDEIPF